jgi:hypothetical protein
MLKVSKSPEAHIRSGEAKRKGGSSLGHGIVMTLLVTLAACAGGAERKQASPTPEARAAAAAGFPLSAQLAIEGGMGVGGLATARAFEARAGGDIDPAPEGWSDLDLSTPPDLGLGPLSFEQAQRLNAYLPTSDGQVPATPFVLKANAAERARALLCLTQAIYYEAALEPTPGQEAVAQTVLNRVRHPAFPKSICGVVFQGANQLTGCQFSFTCDGSRARPPIEPFWSRAKGVAERALDGYVMAPVGLATHYHADYVLPRWGPTMVKIRQFGSQIFYRYPGPLGQRDSYRERYGGGELRVSTAGPSPQAILAYKASNGLTPPVAPGTETYTITDPRTGATTIRVAGQVRPGRRDPTPEEVSRINSVLAEMAGAKSD